MPSAVVDFDDFLALCVRKATGSSTAKPRPGQIQLARQIVSAMEDKTRMMGSAPTGTGKSLAYGAAAAWRHHQRRERTLVSTDAISLQQQLMEKDLPVIARAYEEAFGAEITFGIVKGVSNYVDPLKVVEAISVALGRPIEPTARAVKAAAEKLPAIAERALIQWAVKQMATGGSGDRADCTLEINDTLWASVSASSDEATRLSDQSPWPPPAAAAKGAAAEAVIVVTNHSMLGMQAARGIPLLLSNPNLGLFHNIVVDEGHTLPAKVRDQGALQIAAFTPHAITKAIGRISNQPAAMSALGDLARDAASTIERELDQYLGRQSNRRITEGQHPLQHGITALSRVLSSAETILKDAKRGSYDPALEGRMRAARARLDQTSEALNRILEPDIEWATWVERSDNGGVARISPVNVAALIAGNAWTTRLIGGGVDDDSGEINAGDLVPLEDDEDKAALGVALVSATLPARFGSEVAISGGIQEFESPFADAYRESAVYIPLGGPAFISSLSSAKYGRTSFDVDLHAQWCAQAIVDLVEANGGAAMVLSATRKSGELYAAALRRELDLPIMSQWDGATPRVVAAWREQTEAVLVGTRGLMTGVDAPGETCSLVIVDRPPRAAQNPLDEARVDLLVKESNLDQWAAGSRVYATDAAALLDQAVGRHIRSVSDRGMVVCLDPRIHPGSAKTYNSNDRRLYTHALRKYGQHHDNLDSAVAWLEARHTTRKAA